MKRINQSLFNNSPIEGGYFQLLVIMNKSAMNIYQHLCVNISFHFSWVDTQEWIAGSYSRCKFNFIRNCQIVFQAFLLAICKSSIC